MKALRNLRLWCASIVFVGTFLAVAAPIPAWACIGCATSPCDLCVKCVYQSTCYDSEATVTQGTPPHTCKMFCQMPDGDTHMCTWWSNCYPE
jgi:hypothetical protein